MIPQNRSKYKIFRQKICFRSHILSFDRTCDYAFDDMLLAEKIEYDNRDYSKHEHRHKAAHIGIAVCALHCNLNCNGDCLVIRAQNEIREQIVVPNPHCV